MAYYLPVIYKMIVDVRSTEEYIKSHIKEALNLPLFTLENYIELLKGKEVLYSQVLEKITHDFFALFEERVLTQTDPEQTIASLIELHLSLGEQHHGFSQRIIETLFNS